MTILNALDDAKLFAEAFRPGSTWLAWRVFLQALFALPMREAERALYERYTGREKSPTGPASEAWVIVGRRGGKSRIAALVAVFLAVFRDYSGVLAPGERGTIMLVSADRKQSRVVMRYVVALLESVPMLAGLIEKRTAEAIHLANRITIEVHTASYRTTRGYTLCAAILDELAFWRVEDAAEPDHEIVAALRPGTATVAEPLLLGISSPYARRGVLWQAYREHHGKDGDPVLTWQAPSLVMNPTLSKRTVERAYVEDPSAAAAEYGAEFRSDVESFVSREAVEACVVPGRLELLRIEGVQYAGFVDPSGGSQDSMTLAIGHAEDGRAVLDAIRERRPPFSPDDVVKEFVELLKSYRVSRVTGDRYGGEWPRERFRAHGVEYELAKAPKNELYKALLPELNSGRLELLDLPRLGAQLCGLERRAARGGRDSIDHAPGAHDDVANVVAGLVHTLLARGFELPTEFEFGGEFRVSPWATGGELARWPSD